MGEVAELTYDLAAFVEIMAMIWKRINDHGRNWRHVYKALTLLQYLVRHGHKSVIVQCRENIIVVRTLQDFQYVEDGKDQGLSVRDKAKELVTLLGDERRVRKERARARQRRHANEDQHDGEGVTYRSERVGITVGCFLYLLMLLSICCVAVSILLF